MFCAFAESLILYLHSQTLIIEIYLTYYTLKLLHISLMVYPLSVIMLNFDHYIHPYSSYASMLTDRYSFINQ
jgi:hypothetical protein